MIDFDRLLIQEAAKWIGVREKGFNSGPEVEMFQKAVDGQANKEAYCMAFVQYCIKEVEKITGRKSWLFKSEHCLTVWNKSPQSAKILHPEEGAIVIWGYYTAKGEPTSSGHAGIITSVTSDQIFSTIEANTSDGIGINREGDGVFQRQRRYAKVGRFRIKGFLRPFQQDDV